MRAYLYFKIEFSSFTTKYCQIKIQLKYLTCLLCINKFMKWKNRNKVRCLFDMSPSKFTRKINLLCCDFYKDSQTFQKPFPGFLSRAFLTLGCKEL